MESSTPLRSHGKRLALLAMLLISFLVVPAQPPTARATNSIWYVNHAAGSGGDSTTWASAFTDLQSALAAAEAGDQI